MPRPISQDRKSTSKTPKIAEPTVSELPVSIGLASKLRELDHYLFREFGAGATFSYIIGGNGKVLAESSVHGIVVPSVKDEPQEGRVYSENDLWQQPSGTLVLHPVYGSGVIQRAGRVTDTALDDRVVAFENGDRFVLPAPVETMCAPPWNVVVKVIRRTDTEISTTFSSKV